MSKQEELKSRLALFDSLPPPDDDDDEEKAVRSHVLKERLSCFESLPHDVPELVSESESDDDEELYDDGEELHDDYESYGDDDEDEAAVRSHVLTDRLSLFDSLPSDSDSESDNIEELHDIDEELPDESSASLPSSPPISLPLCTEEYTFLPGCVEKRPDCVNCPVTYKSNKDLAEKAMRLDISSVSVVL